MRTFGSIPRLVVVLNLLAFGSVVTCQAAKVSMWSSRVLLETSPILVESILPYGSKSKSFLWVSTSGLHSLAVTTEGAVVAWGLNHLGQCMVPTGLDDVSLVAAGRFHSVALKRDGTVVAWGSNTYGQATVPDGLAGVAKIVAGEFHSMAVKSNGTIVAWGRDDYGQATIPSGLTNVVQLVGGYAHTLALMSDGTVVAWGAGGVGMTNEPHFGQSIVPNGLSNVVSIAAAAYRNIAARSDGSVVAWGMRFGSTDQSQVALASSNVVSVAAGTFHALLVQSEPLQIESPTLSNNLFRASFPTTAGRDYFVHRSDSLSASGWSSISTNRGSGGAVFLQDPVHQNARSFYRVEQR